MRRDEKEIQDPKQMEAVIRRADICHLGMSDRGAPYVVPMNFGYRRRTLYFHSAAAGRKIDILKQNPSVCAVFSVDRELVRGEKPCKWGMHFQCVMAFGTASFLEDPAEKRMALNLIIAQYAEGGFDFPDNTVDATTIIRVDIETFTGKHS